MKKFGFATVIASGLVAGVLGFAAPAAQAAPLVPSIIPTGVDHHTWLDQIGPNVAVPQVDTTVHQSR
jgi:S1-C subfamily serine protease